ncbi:ABC transporter substrate-binding protein [Microcella sp.]|uniref:ABC transporter substrate-binding protein n=1 Tax=Microcella sp. TaxID=1913979 RepID=UPI003F700C86
MELAPVNDDIKRENHEMAMKHIAGLAVIAVALTGCAATPAEPEPSDEITGEITVLTNRTDLVDTLFQEYKASFEAKYPGTEVNFEAITDYDGEVSIRLNTDDYGDVLIVPNSVTPDQYPLFFEPLGTVDELSQTYRFIPETAYEGQGYGIAVVGNAGGIVYNKAVWEAAGVTELPTTPDEFLEALQAIDENTDAIPYYTNYADGWPLTNWGRNRGIMADESYSINLTQLDSPWADDEYYGITDGLLYDIVAAGLSEPDPLTTNWEESKTLLGTGQVASMVLGSWAVSQMRAAAETAGGSADDIGYMPFPLQVDGTFHSTVFGDRKNAINVNSDNKVTARAWIEWFASESGFAQSQGGLSPLLEGEIPDTLDDFVAAGVEFIQLAPAPAGEESLESDIANTAEIDLFGPIYRRQMIDVARGAADGDKESFFAQLNQRWADARAQVSN